MGLGSKITAGLFASYLAAAPAGLEAKFHQDEKRPDIPYVIYQSSAMFLRKYALNKRDEADVQWKNGERARSIENFQTAAKMLRKTLTANIDYDYISTEMKLAEALFKEGELRVKHNLPYREFFEESARAAQRVTEEYLLNGDYSNVSKEDVDNLAIMFAYQADSYIQLGDNAKTLASLIKLIRFKNLPAIKEHIIDAAAKVSEEIFMIATEDLRYILGDAAIPLIEDAVKKRNLVQPVPTLSF